MKISRSSALFFTLFIIFLGWQMISQLDALAASLGIHLSPKLAVSDQCIVS